MKKTLCFMLAMLAVLSSASLAMAFKVGEQTADLTVGTTYVTKYMFRGVDTFADDDGGIQPYATLTVHPFESNLSVGYWGSYSLYEGHENVDEQDYWFGWNKDIASLINIGTGYTYYDFYNADTKGDINEWYWSATLLHIPLPGEVDLGSFGKWDNLPVTLGYYAAYAWGNVSQAKGGIDNGWYHAVNIGMKFPIPGSEKIPSQPNGLNLTYDNVFGFYDGQLGFGSGFAFWTQSVGLPLDLPGPLTLTPKLNYQVTDGAIFTGAEEDEFYFTLDLNAIF